MNKFLITKLVTNYSKITLRIIFTSDLPESTDKTAHYTIYIKIISVYYMTEQKEEKRVGEKNQLKVKGGEQMGCRLKNLGKN